MYALVGPTAVGKTELSLQVARELDAEIISCDSMQVYRDMPVLTQAATPVQRALVPHHMVEVIDPEAEFNAADYRAGALQAMAEISARGKAILITGGTGLYLEALRQGLCEAPPAEAKIRQQLESRLREEGAETLYGELAETDPETAAGLHTNDTRRVIRALEVAAVSGRPLSQWWAAHRQDRQAIPMRILVVTRDRETLYARINRRLLDMTENEGLLDEARPLLQRKLSKTAWQVHGLRHLKALFEGRMTQAAMVETWQREVRNYAKRQLSWFRNRLEAEWLEIREEASAETLSKQATAALRHD